MARIGIASADHALACALFGQLRPGDHALFVSPGLGEDTQALLSGPLGSLEDWGVKCTVIDPFEAELISQSGELDTASIVACTQKHQPDVVVLQRWLPPALLLNVDADLHANSSNSSSSSNPTLYKGNFFTCSAIQCFGDAVRGSCMHSVDSDAVRVAHGGTLGESVVSTADARSQPVQAPLVVVDNRGGEFIERVEPGATGADLVTGSLLGSLGGGIAPGGGYVCGTQELVEKACARFCAPGAVLQMLWMKCNVAC